LVRKKERNKVRNIQKYIDAVEFAIANADSGSTKLTDKQLSLEGMSSNKTRIFLNELIKEDTNYLEIGTYKGSTFVSALYNNNPLNAYAIDNFSLDSFYGGSEQEFLATCEYNEIVNFKFFNENSFDMKVESKNKIKDINVYFYDGEHEEIDQCKAITDFLENLSNEFILIVDDWNWDKVKNGTYAGISQSNLKIHKKWELPAAYNGDKAQWHNGMFVAILEK